MESIEDIRRQMAEIRRGLPDDVESVVQRARTLADWRYYIRNYPWLCMAAAAAAGYLVVPRRRNSGRPDPKTLAEKAESPPNLPLRPGYSKTTTERLVDALAKAAVGAAAGLLSHQLSRFLGSDSDGGGGR